MTPHRVARVVGRLIALVVLVFSGTYLLIYLYRWEWNRALVAGLFFVSAEVALIAGVILSRLRAIEDRLAEGPAPAPTPPPAGPDGKAGRRSPFGWLEPGEGQVGVFIPVLLGAGVILSGLAYVVERVARFTAAPVAEHDLAARMASLAPPTETLVPDVGAVPRPADELEGSGHRAGRDPLRRAAVWVTAAVLGLALVIGVDALRDATMTVPEAHDPDAVLTLTLDVDTREAFGSVEQLVEALYVACRVRLPGETRALEIGRTEAGLGRLVVSPALGDTTRRRFVGCLEDATIDRVNADVVSIEESSATTE